MSESKQNSPESFETPMPNSGKVSEETSPSVKSYKFLIVGVAVLLLLVTGLVVYVFAQNQSLKSQLSLGSACEYEGETYEVGEGFTASDGCNSCSCEPNGEVACTDMACFSDEEAGVDPTANWQVYVDREYSFKYPEKLSVIKNSEQDVEGYETFNLIDNMTNDVVYKITISDRPNSYVGTLQQQHQDQNKIPKLTSFTDLRGRQWNIEDPVWGAADNVDVYSENTIDENYHQVRILTTTRALSRFLGAEMMIQNGDGFDASPSIEHLEVFNNQFLSTFEFTDQTQDTITLTGRLVSMERPDPDINYDFQLLLDIPFFDELNAQGPRDITTIIVVPENESVRQMLTENLGNSVSIEGKIEWGLAETRHLLATSVNSKD